MEKQASQLARKKAKQVKNGMDWRRVEELLAEKLADKVKIKLKVREAEAEEEFDDDGFEEGEFTLEEIDEEMKARELAHFFIHRHFHKTKRVG